MALALTERLSQPGGTASEASLLRPMDRQLPRRQDAKEPAWHRRERQRRSDARVVVRLAAACIRLVRHHGSSVPKVLRAFTDRAQPCGATAVISATLTAPGAASATTLTSFSLPSSSVGRATAVTSVTLAAGVGWGTMAASSTLPPLGAYSSAVAAPTALLLPFGAGVDPYDIADAYWVNPSGSPRATNGNATLPNLSETSAGHAFEEVNCNVRARTVSFVIDDDGGDKVNDSLHDSDHKKNNNVIDLTGDMLECGCGYCCDNISYMRSHLGSGACWYSWTKAGEDDFLELKRDTIDQVCNPCSVDKPPTEKSRKQSVYLEGAQKRPRE